MVILCIGYRAWALEIYKRVQQQTSDEHEFITISTENGSIEPMIEKIGPELILFYGWSSLVGESLTSNYTCLMLHPSPLPKYRGGSPIQNQVLRGDVSSAVTIFRLSTGIDDGDIVLQRPLMLTGKIEHIFDKIIEIGVSMTLEILRSGLSFTPQVHDQATYYPRRKPAESELTIEELLNCDSLYLLRKIEILRAPYPNAFIRTIDGRKLYITDAYIGDEGEQ